MAGAQAITHADGSQSRDSRRGDEPLDLAAGLIHGGVMRLLGDRLAEDAN